MRRDGKRNRQNVSHAKNFCSQKFARFFSFFGAKNKRKRKTWIRESAFNIPDEPSLWTNWLTKNCLLLPPISIPCKSSYASFLSRCRVKETKVLCGENWKSGQISKLFRNNMSESRAKDFPNRWLEFIRRCRCGLNGKWSRTPFREGQLNIYLF